MVMNGNVPCHLQQCKCPDQDLWAPLYRQEVPEEDRLKGETKSATGRVNLPGRGDAMLTV